MKKEPLIVGGNTEAATTARAVVRYIKQGMAQDRCTQRDAALNAFVFLCGTILSMGVSFPQMFACFMSLAVEILKAKIKGKFKR